MKKMTIYREVRSEDDHSKILRKDALRTVNVTPDFQGFGEKGAIIEGEFKKLADFLEPDNTGFSLS